MILELEFDLQHKTNYLSTRLNALGQAKFTDLLRKPFEDGNDTSLAMEIRSGLHKSERVNFFEIYSDYIELTFSEIQLTQSTRDEIFIY